MANALPLDLLRQIATTEPKVSPMSGITVNNKHDDTEHRFDSSDLSATYSAEFTEAGDLVVTIDVYRGSELISSIPTRRFAACEVDGFTEN